MNVKNEFRHWCLDMAAVTEDDTYLDVMAKAEQMPRQFWDSAKDIPEYFDRIKSA